jgi:hypothetical protein
VYIYSRLILKLVTYVGDERVARCYELISKVMSYRDEQKKQPNKLGMGIGYWVFLVLNTHLIT